MIEEDVNELLTLAKEAARSAGKVIVSTRPCVIETKSHCNDFVTDIDKKCEKIISDLLQKSKISVLGEESGKEYNDQEGNLWVVDPIDGTANYVKNNPLVGVNIALISDGEIVIGVTYLPYFDEMYYAIKGRGSYCNNERYFRQDTPFGVIITDPNEELCRKDSNRKLGSFRRLGASSVEMAWCSKGMYSALLYKKNKVWDIAPGCLLIAEAGGVYKTRVDSNATGSLLKNCDILAGNEQKVEEISDLLLNGN